MKRNSRFINYKWHWTGLISFTYIHTYVHYIYVCMCCYVRHMLTLTLPRHLYSINISFLPLHPYPPSLTLTTLFQLNIPNTKTELVLISIFNSHQIIKFSFFRCTYICMYTCMYVMHGGEGVWFGECGPTDFLLFLLWLAFTFFGAAFESKKTCPVVTSWSPFF
jgi:hypothetical protein